MDHQRILFQHLRSEWQDLVSEAGIKKRGISSECFTHAEAHISFVMVGYQRPKKSLSGTYVYDLIYGEALTMLNREELDTSL